ncbi:MAG: hypothetical protein RSC93_09985 [Erysipelotrichaceae bacterium]
MRRFLADVLLILILVAIGDYITDAKPEKKVVELKQKVNDFEADIVNHKKIEAKVSETSLNEIEENTASRIALDTSNFIVDVADTGAMIVSEIFHGLTQ